VAVAAPCRNHPEREAIGVCVKCRVRVCSECSTKVDGINHCVTCLEALAAPARAKTAAPQAAGAASTIAGALLLATTAGLAWAFLELAMP
jgi:hypothetical protein